MEAEALASAHMLARPTVASLFRHMHHERLCSVLENVPESGGAEPEGEWREELIEIGPEPRLERPIRVTATIVTGLVTDGIRSSRRYRMSTTGPNSACDPTAVPWHYWRRGSPDAQH